jgi:Protein of unknown function (DUF1592)/Protein of unknown function (DUF1588)/Protein of unknown function (DUF1595)/Protein of unknown function (DUF1587)/Protein of unknown function (DUF1585)
MGRSSQGLLGLACLLALASWSCSGSIDEPTALWPGDAEPVAASPAANGGSGGSGGSGRPPAAGGPSLPPGKVDCSPGTPPATTRLARLTHHQYDNTVRDLTGLTLGFAAEFLADPHQAGFDRGLDLQVGDVLAKAYRDAAEKVADTVVSDAAAYSRVVGCSPAQGDTCAKTFIAEFGKKAWRRPLTDAEQASLLTLFKLGPDVVDAGDDFQKGVRVTLEALLQSPKFLYRIELSNQVDKGMIKLNGYEVASRLSFMLANTTPDATLLTAAANNQLGTPDLIAAQATRLLQTPNAHETVRDFHHQWLDLDIYPNKLTKDPKLYPSVTPDLAPVMQSEVEKFVDAVTFERKAGYASLLTAPFSYVNKTTAALYGVTGSFSDNLQRVDLNVAERAGLLTQVGFLATHAFSGSSSPIHRGVFIQRRLLCNQIPDPPANVPSLPPLDGTSIKTTRQQVDQHTANEPCASCHHTFINPLGFGLENFDAVGRFRTSENGEPIDASGVLAGTEQRAPFSNGVELSHAIAGAPEAQLCYAKNWFRYTFGRQETDADSCDLSRIAEKLASDQYTALDVLTDLTRTQAFSVRTAEVP